MMSSSIKVGDFNNGLKDKLDAAKNYQKCVICAMYCF